MQIVQDSDNVSGGSTSELSRIIECEDIQPGSGTSYEICKLIYLFHPLGGKMVDRPIKMAMNVPRKASVEGALNEYLTDAFTREWEALGADGIIQNVASQCRIYGVAAVTILVDGEDPDKMLDLSKIADKSISFNIMDPLNTAGSIILNQDPNSQSFQKVEGIRVQSKSYHASRCRVMCNENPIYLAYTGSAFGFSGRSVFQRALFPLKSFIQTMRTDDMVSMKGGLLIMKTAPAGSVISRIAQGVGAIKRAMLKRGGTGDVLQIGPDDSIESLDLNNIDKSLDSARNHIVQNIAAAADMPAIILNNETFASGFAEGSEDSKSVAVYIDDIRKWLEPVYKFLIAICQYRAWTKEFYEALQNEIPEVTGSYQTQFNRWVKDFKYVWPDSIKEPESERIKVDEIRFKAITTMAEVLLPQFANDPVNRTALINWMGDNANTNDTLFPMALELDTESMYDNPPSVAPEEPKDPMEGDTL